VIYPTERHLLAPLDFDLSFTYDSCTEQVSLLGCEWIFLLLVRLRLSLQNRERIEDWKLLEVNGMKMALAGDTINSGASGSLELENKELDSLKWALR